MKLLKGYRKYLYERDTVFATIAVFLVIGLLALVTLNTHILNPVTEAFADFDFNDIAYAKVGKKDKIPFDNRIVIVNIGYSDRAGIAGMLEKVASYKPKVIGLDALLEGPREPQSDSLLGKVLYSIPNLVMASRLDWDGHGEHLEVKNGYFNRPGGNFAFVNLVGEEKGTIRHYSPFEEYHHKEYLSFGAAILEKSYPKQYKRLYARHKEIEIINYSRNVDKYLTIDGQDVLADNVVDTIFANKIVLFGYLNPSPNDVEDKFYTAMNPKMVSTSPDMNGIVIHANFLSMALDNKYIHSTPKWLNWILTLLIAWLHVSLFIRYYIDTHLWFHLVAKGAQLISAFIFVALSVWCLSYFSLKLDLKMAVTVIILAIDVIYFYEALAVWLREKFGFKTIF